MDWDCEFRLKRILFNGSYKRILCQNENGPCPLLAISNILILKNVLGFGTTKATIPASRIVQALANILLEQQEKLLSCTNDSHLAERRLEQLHCVIDTLPSLLGGMDVNIKFTDIDAFEFTQQLSVLDAFDLKLFHGWCIDPSEV